MVKLFARLVLLGLVLLFGSAAGLVLAKANNDARPDAQAMVVLGSAQFDGRPQPVFENRLRHAADRYKQSAQLIFTVGGKLPGDRFTEAQAGKRWLVANGVKESDVIVVPRGSDTWESLQAVAAVAKDRSITRITVVSDAAHVARCQSMLKHLGVSDVTVSPTKSGPGSELTGRYVTRETLALVRFWIADVWVS